MTIRIPAGLLLTSALFGQASAPAPAEEVTIAVGDGSVRLAGSLSVPDGAGPFPAVLLVPGGSPFDRDETMFGHKPFRCLAAALHAEGFATLRMDDRGVGGSGGKKLQCTLGELAQDVAACLDWLGQRPGVDRGRLVVVGHSQGGYLGARVAATRGGVAGLVLLGAPGLPVGEILARELARDGHGQETRNLAMMGLARAVSGSGPEAVRQLGEAWAKFVSDLPAPEQEAAEAFLGKVRPQVRTFFAAPMLRETLFHDPRADLAAVKCPVLVVTGALDRPMLAGLPELVAATAGRGVDLSLRVLPGINHALLEHADPDPRTWSRAPHEVAPAVLACLRAWLQERQRP